MGTQLAAPAVTKITKFDKASLTTLRPVIEKAVKAALEPYGLEVSLGGIKYGETNFKGTLEVSTADDGQRTFTELAKYSGGTLKAEWFGKTFISKGEEYRITGANPGRKFNVEAVRLRDQKTFGFQATGIHMFMDPEGWKAEQKRKQREQFIRNLKLLTFSKKQRPDAYVPYGNLDDSWLGKELSNGSKVLGLRDEPWAKSAANNAVVTEKAGTIDYVSIADFQNMTRLVAAAV